MKRLENDEEVRMKTISISSIDTISTPQLGRRVSFEINDGRSAGNLWFEVEPEFASALSEDRCDAVLIAILPFAVRLGYERIETNVGVSEDLLAGLQNHVLPQLLVSHGRGGDEIVISAPHIPAVVGAYGVATGMSLGVDSMATLKEYSADFRFPSYRLTHLTYFNVGAHHGQDVRLGRSALSKQELFHGQLDRAREFADTLGYPLVLVDSNMSEFLARMFGRSYFARTHTFRNAASAAAVQNLIGKYYYSAAFNLTRFELSSSSKDSAAYEKWLLANLFTGSLRFFSSNKAWSRFEKVREISDFTASYKYLTVCLLDVENCGECAKCQKTLMMLDVLGNGVLERYSDSFNLDEYKARHRDEWFGKLYELMHLKGVHGSDMRELFRFGISHALPARVNEPRGRKLKDPTIASVVEGGANLRALPNLRAEKIRHIPAMQTLTCLEKYYSWFRVSSQGIEGYVRSDRVRLHVGEDASSGF